ncbi:RHS repeat domain-containing protein [Comamonas sp. JC664]
MNGSNQLLTQTDANGHSTRYGYDSAGRRVHAPCQAARAKAWSTTAKAVW